MLIQGLKLFVVSRYVDATDVVTGGLAVLAGWGLALAVRRRRAVVLSGRRTRLLVGLLLLAWLATALFVNWQPFDFTWDAGFAGGRLREIALVPFADYYWGNYWNGFDQFVHKLVLFVPLGMLLTVALPVAARGRGVLVVVLAALVAAGIEAGQLFLPNALRQRHGRVDREQRGLGRPDRDPPSPGPRRTRSGRPGFPGRGVNATNLLSWETL